MAPAAGTRCHPVLRPVGTCERKQHFNPGGSKVSDGQIRNGKPRPASPPVHFPTRRRSQDISALEIADPSPLLDGVGRLQKR